MKFGPVPLTQARGAIVAHSQRVGERMIRQTAPVWRQAAEQGMGCAVTGPLLYMSNLELNATGDSAIAKTFQHDGKRSNP